MDFDQLMLYPGSVNEDGFIFTYVKRDPAVFCLSSGFAHMTGMMSIIHNDTVFFKG